MMGRTFSPQNLFGFGSYGVAIGYYVSRRWRLEENNPGKSGVKPPQSKALRATPG